VAERVYSVETPENLTLYFERAGFASRALALGVDATLMAMATQGAILALSPLGLVAESAAGALWIIVAFLIQWGYGAFSEWRFAGRTLGKSLNGLAVVDASGLRLSFSQAAVRNLVRMIDMLPGFYLLGAAFCLLDRHGRRLGDLAARTVVVRAQRPAPPKEHAPAPLDVLLSHGGPARFEASLGPWGAPILANMHSDERAALLALCAALETLSLADRLSLCNALAQHFVKRHQLALPTHLSAERLLLLVRDRIGPQEGQPVREPAPA
jgi:uncharacterized RDD family membrane protein YckC